MITSMRHRVPWTIISLFVQAWAVPLFVPLGAAESDRPLVWTIAHLVPEETTSEQSGYFSLVEGKNGKLYLGTAKYGENAYLVEFDPHDGGMRVVVDAQKAIGTQATGFAAQAKIHTRNNVGPSGRIYFGTKQGYPKAGEKPTDYPGGYPMVYDPATGKVRVYPIPILHQGIISIMPDESRNIAYISTCSDERPVESSHFMILDLETGKYRDLLDTRHMYAFIVLDHLGRAYHPVMGGKVARYDPRSDRLEILQVKVDGKEPAAESLLAHPQTHPLNWETSPDRRWLYVIPMSRNQLYRFDLTGDSGLLEGQALGALLEGAEKTDCRAMCVGPDGTVWAGVAATWPDGSQRLHLVSYRPSQGLMRDHGQLAIANPEYARFTDEQGKPRAFHHGVERLPNGALAPRYVIMAICAAHDGRVYLTTLYPFTLHEIRFPKVAGITTVYRENSHADVILGRLLQTETLDDKGRHPNMQLASLFTDQVPSNDWSRPLGERYGVPVFESVRQAVTRGTDRLAVDGVLLVAEHGDYPESATGQIQYPKRRLFSEILAEFDRSGRVVPVFIDKHLADNWQDIQWIYEQAAERKVPLMAGSSLPVLWRYPPVDVERGRPLKEIVAVSYHRLDAYGFHALEMVQCLAERRRGGETGVRSVMCLSGPAVWEAKDRGVFDQELLRRALERLRRPLPAGKSLEELVPEPVLFVVDYRDGLRASILTLNPAIAEWAVAWRYADNEEVVSTLFYTQEQRPFMHFTYLVRGIEKLMQTSRPAWPVERTLLTSGVLDALLQSKASGGKQLMTPHLAISYQCDWNWRQPPEPPQQ
ncbi:MAG: hypothetical protein KatS3mg110_2560 [Pirellulaceae bacterium]|nr:MAG: hypothetical protein KatS3mg110_2560 [Pirellulaceae bacterium]